MPAIAWQTWNATQDVPQDDLHYREQKGFHTRKSITCERLSIIYRVDIVTFVGLIYGDLV